MSLSIRFLGTCAARPTVERNVTSLALIREGETLLFDCGEGTQRQMMRFGITFALNDIFFTHLHADHMLGVIGLCRTLGLQGRTETMRLYGPPGSERYLKRAIAIGSEKQHFPIEYIEVTPGTPLRRSGYEVRPFPVQHAGTVAVGYAIVEETRLGRFNPDLARDMGIPEGPMWGQLHRGNAVTLSDGRIVESSALVGPARPGRTVVITGDCRPSDETVEFARDADLLVHEATFGTEEAARAVETGHSTAAEAAEIATRAGVRQLVLTHISARYSQNAVELLDEARAIFPNSVVARDGMEVEVPFQGNEGSEGLRSV
jgi:ribonuclease Z